MTKFSASCLSGLLFASSLALGAEPVTGIREETPLRETRSSVLELQASALFPGYGYEWIFERGHASASGPSSGEYCRLQITRLRGLQLSELREKTLRVAQVSPFSSKKSLLFQAGAFIDLRYQNSAGGEFTGKLTCFAEPSRERRLFTVGELKNALGQIARVADRRENQSSKTIALARPAVRSSSPKTVFVTARRSGRLQVNSLE